VGFESSDVARRRLTAMAMSDRRVQEALVTAGSEAIWGGPSIALGAPDHPEIGGALVGSLEVLAQDIADTPGAGGALLAAFAEQVRVLRLVAEATRRAPGEPLPATVLAAVHGAIGEASFGTPAARPAWSVAPPMQ
jgi:hypothetical protein